MVVGDDVAVDAINELYSILVHSRNHINSNKQNFVCSKLHIFESRGIGIKI